MRTKKHFSRFLISGQLHFAAHSHHPWPDVSFSAQQQAWLDAAALADRKWDKVFGDVLPAAQAHVARILHLPDPRSIAFAPNTHELFMRLWSCCPRDVPRVLTTDSEFHSFSRQMKRLEEDGKAEVRRVSVAPYASFEERFIAQARREHYDFVVFSQVFYDTGFRVLDLDALVRAVSDSATVVVIDGYHGYMAVPTDIGNIAQRAFYIAGGYKYAMAGEGACFMHCPPGYAERPPNTGWYAAFGTLARGQAALQVPYAEGGQRFMGATFDPTALYRLNAVHEWMLRENLTVDAIHTHVENLQSRFLAQRADRDLLKPGVMLPPEGQPRGNFLVFRHPRAGQWHRSLLDAGVVTDCRDDRLRIGFGLYHEPRDVDALANRIAGLRID
ncbi:MAG TPA: aminotransferase class V-fold PLP-dependent enzyme [Candidatus Binatia bacterium]|nr:aminotransferase class V-fold PLP-dependent enzyme [Candidatus Binatia bacterium]